MRLRAKVLLYSSALIVALIAAMLVYVDIQARRFVSDSLARDLVQGRERIQDAEEQRIRSVRNLAQLVASFPKLKSMLATDSATIRDFLLSYREENQRTELLIVLDNAGRVLARTDSADPSPLTEARARWIDPLLKDSGRGSVSSTLKTPTGTFTAVSVPADAGGQVFGFVIAAKPVNDDYAAELAGTKQSKTSQNEFVLVSDRVLGSTIPAPSLPYHAQQDWIHHLSLTGPATIEVGGESYSALSALSSDGGYLAIAMRSRDKAMQPYRDIQFGLLLLGLAAALAGILGSALLAGNVTNPVKELVAGTERVNAGDLDFRIDVRASDEIGDLARAFNAMVQGLRERANMQKFVSRSTLEMIKASLQRDVSAGQRMELTIFFSDMRNFSAMSEQRPPEEAVEILNTCFSLQADIIKKFRGDIDKYVGDAVVAVFSGKDMAHNAVHCAAGIQKAIATHNARLGPDEYAIAIGIGIVTGEAILGSVGSADRQDFTVIGSNVNLCARLCGKAAPHEILISESTYQRVKDSVGAEPMEPLTVKGFSKPIHVYRMEVGASDRTARA